MKVKYYKAKFIIVWDKGQHKTLKDGYLGVKNDKIEGYYKGIPDGAEYEDLGNAAITPGFINTHCHPCETNSIKSYQEDIGNPNFYESGLYDYLLVLPFGKEGSILQAKLSTMEILKSGCTTALINGGPISREEARIAGEIGMRAYVGGAVRAGDPYEERAIWHSPDGHSLEYNFDEESGMQRIDEAEGFIKEIEGSYEGRINGYWAPTQTMTCTPKMLKEVRKRADKMGVGITIHGAESIIEFESCIRQYGKTPVHFMADTGMLGQDVIIGHCIFTTGHSQVFMAGDKDLKLLGDSHSTVAHSPSVFAKGGTILESFRKYADYGVNMTIGTDSYPSDIIQEMRFASSLGKIAEQSTFALSAKEIFYAATVNGAKALGRDDLGKLEKGAKADFVVFSLDNLEMSPVRDLVKNLIYCGTRHSVARVYVDGRCVVKDGEIPSMNEKELAAEFQEKAEVVWSNTAKYDRKRRNVDELSPLACPEYLE